MSTVITHAVVSVDGFIADKNDEVGRCSTYFNGDVPIENSSGMKVSQASGVRQQHVGQHRGGGDGPPMFDITNGWEASRPPVTTWSWSRTGPGPGWHPEASHYHFAGDVTAAIAKARELAGDRVRGRVRGDVAGQALALGLVDEVAMDVVPVVFGSGKRYFGPVDSQHLSRTRTR